MSQAVDRLKELLFDSEARTLADVTRRLDAVFERAGTEERFTASVAGTLDSALRKAEVDRHAALANAIAPLITRTIKTEIANSKDELVDALYPMTGRMVKAYVASALKDLANDINRRLEANPVMLRLKSLTSGKSVGELALADAQKLRIEELFLVRRGSGELIGRWPEAAPGEDGRDHVMSGILTAINEFSSEALADEGSALRQIDIGERQLYLRASEAYLLAAKCSGTAPHDVEKLLDEAFLATLDGIHHDSTTYGSLEAAATRRGALLSEVSSELDEKLAERQDGLASAGISPLKLLTWVIGLPLAAWSAWWLYADWRTGRTQAIAARVIAEVQELKGYPTRITVEPLGYSLTIGGLAPSEAARKDAVARIEQALPGTEVRDQITVLPSGLAEIEPKLAEVRRDVAGLEAEVEPEIQGVKRDLAGLRTAVEPGLAEVRRGLADLKSAVEPEIVDVKRELAAIDPAIEGVRREIAAAEAAAVRRALDRASERLGEIGAGMTGLEGAVGDPKGKDLVRRSARIIEETQRRVRAQGRETDPQRLAALNGKLADETRRLRVVEAELSGLIAAGFARTSAPPAGAPPADVRESAEQLSSEAERLAVLTTAITQVMALKDSLPKEHVSPREQLEAWARANAIFFSNGTDYRNPGRAAAAIGELAGLVRGSGLLLRVVGYTDDQGGQAQNLPLSQQRADKVAAELVARGVPASKIVALGRLDTLGLSPRNGGSSPNRRVEFEVGFDGEGAE